MEKGKIHLITRSKTPINPYLAHLLRNQINSAITLIDLVQLHDIGMILEENIKTFQKLHSY